MRFLTGTGIEVDQDRLVRNLAAERVFVRDFGADLYSAVDRGDGPLGILRCVYFTRIFCPERDRMGSYVRLHFFVAEPRQTADVTAELDRMLADHERRHPGSIFQVMKEDSIDGIGVEARYKGAETFPELYYGHMESLSRTAVQLFRKGATDADGEVSPIVRALVHNVWNLLLGGEPFRAS